MQDDEDKDEEEDDGDKTKIADAERKYDRIVISPISFSCATKECDESAYNNNNFKLKIGKSHRRRGHLQL